MNRVLALFAVLLSVIMLAACESIPKIEYREVPVPRYILPPDELILDCPAEPPHFSIDEYISLADEAKEEALVKYANALLGTNIICNKRLDGLRVWKLQKLEQQRLDLEAAEKLKQQK